MFIPTHEISFPPVELADKDGLLAIGGDLSVERLLLAYRKGIFPWYNEDESILWWSPDPRFVLFPNELKLSKSMKAILNKDSFEFSINKAFTEVINNCRSIPRKGQEGTWIQPSIIKAYSRLFESGYALSAEAWKEGELAGGLYGVLIGKIFFGESMFTKNENASKFALYKLIHYLEKKGLALIDCQVYTPHLESLGARMIKRKEFIDLVSKLCQEEMDTT